MSFMKLLTEKLCLSVTNPILIPAEGLSGDLKEVKKKLEESKQRLHMDEEELGNIKQLMDDAKTIYYDNKRLNEIIEQVSDLTYAMAWQKDIDGLYQYANKIHCVRFFGLPESCHHYIVGKSDVDLINYYIERTGNRNTFGELCISTDLHCREQGTRCHYIELGWQGDSLMLLNVRKAPRFDEDGNCIGTVGVAMEDSVNCREIIETLPNRIRQGEVEELDRGVWWVKENPCTYNYLQPGEVPKFNP